MSECDNDNIFSVNFMSKTPRGPESEINKKKKANLNLFIILNNVDAKLTDGAFNDQ